MSSVTSNHLLVRSRSEKAKPSQCELMESSAAVWKRLKRHELRREWRGGKASQKGTTASPGRR